MKKVLHLVAGELSWGAARGAYNLHRGLLDQGVDSVLLANSKNKIKDASVKYIQDYMDYSFWAKVRRKIDYFLLKNKNIKGGPLFSTGFYGYKLDKLDLFRNADIIHLHWVNGLVDVANTKWMNKPVVWTMRDMWPMTGGCHYSMGCDRFQDGCGCCPQLDSSSVYDLSSLVLMRKKRKLPSHLYLVGISRWLSEQASRSYIFREAKIRTISNCIDMETFCPENKAEARKKLSIKTQKKIVLIGSLKLSDSYKGFRHTLSVIKKLDSKKFYVMFFGKIDEDVLKMINCEYKSLGYLGDKSLKTAYSAADIFLSTSVEEAFGKTLVEAMACGTPVVCFDSCGPRDIVDHKVDGYKAEPLNEEDLLSGISWVVENSNYHQLAKKANAKVKAMFSTSVAAKKYQELYGLVTKSQLEDSL